MTILLLACMMLSTLAPHRASADFFVDQQVGEACDGVRDATALQWAGPAGQSFVPSHTYHLGVELCLTPQEAGGDRQVEVRIHEDSIDGPVVRGTYSAKVPTPGAGWKSFPFGEMIPLIVGRTYVIEVMAASPYWAWDRTPGHCCEAGIAYLRGEADPDWDWYFKTLVTDVTATRSRSWSAVHALFDLD